MAIVTGIVVVIALTTILVIILVQRPMTVSSLREIASTEVVADAVVRIAAVLLAIFIAGTLMNFAKYYAQLARQLEALADSLVLSEGDGGKVKGYYDIATGAQLSFGRDPRTPIAEVTQLIEKVGKIKVPQ